MNENQTATRSITDHVVNRLNDAIKIKVADLPGPGGANHLYDLILYGNPEGTSRGVGRVYIGDPIKKLRIEFQNGPVTEYNVGHNGFTNEALLAVLIDRMRGFQGMNPLPENCGASVAYEKGKYACRENAIALTHLEDALMWLQKRTRERMARGVEGTRLK